MEVSIISVLTATVISQQQQIEKLKEQINTDSRNSSLPPSKDFKKKKKKSTQPKSKNKQGAQPGHKGVTRKKISSEKVDFHKNIIAPKNCPGCNENLIPATRIKHQVYDIHDNNIKSTEYTLERGRCKSCRKTYTGVLPEGIDRSIFGPNLIACITAFVVEYRLSKRLIVKILKDLFDFECCVGSISNIEHKVARALQATYDNCAKKIQLESAVHIDETRHLEKNHTNWAWIAASEDATVFLMHKSRGRKVARSLLGEDYSGTLISDRYAAYNYHPVHKRQICLAHLKRDFNKIAQRSGVAGQYGDIFLVLLERIFYFWRKFNNKDITREKFIKQANQIKECFYSKLQSAVNIPHQATVNTINNILNVFDGLWTFCTVDGVEPTNNHAEQQLRSYVIYRKLSFGTQSERGTLFLQRAFSILLTCKKQALKFRDYVAENIKAFTSNIPPPLIFA
jgi:transposase